MSNTTPELTVIGWVSKDPDVGTTQNGKRFVNVSVPHQRQKRNQQGGYDKQGETTWYQATFWDDEADMIASTVRKGDKVIVVGVPEAYGYLKSDGTAAVSVRLLFATLGLIPKVNGPQTGAQGQPAQNVQQNQQWQQQGGTYNSEVPF